MTELAKSFKISDLEESNMKLFFEKVRTPKKDMSLKIQIMVTIGIIVFGFALGVFQIMPHFG